MTMLMFGEPDIATCRLPPNYRPIKARSDPRGSGRRFENCYHVGRSSHAVACPSFEHRHQMKWLKRSLLVCAIGYPLALAITALSFRYVGEEWWATSVGLYLPRVAFALPLPFLVVALLIFRLRSLLWTQLAAALLVLFPLMGLVISWPSSGPKDGPRIRVLSLNADSGYFGNDKIDEQIRAYSPDIVALQEVQLFARELPNVLRERYPNVEMFSQFIVASRYPIMSVIDPAMFPHLGRMRSARFARFLVDTPVGRIALYNVHPISPRSVFYELRGRGLRREILSGHILSGSAAADIMENNEVRRLEIQTASEMAAKDPYPVLITSDTNLPGLSSIYGRYLSQFQDGFSKVGLGFGYTFQSYRRWMRLDRILASDELRFEHVEAGCPLVSDHLCVVADLGRREP
jgi:endonuclease/exonuclease/phosphatase (EEP) superfamily protein YafD